jgi:cytochrome c oxidase accessory protein FixG
MSAGLHVLPSEELVLPTLKNDGNRRWLQPSVIRGKWWWRRMVVAYSIIFLFFLIPHLKWHGKPLVLLDIVSRRFSILGYTFLPTDTLLLALLVVGLFLTIFFTTALFGRAFCGWACPHTMWMEFVFRPIERWLEGPDYGKAHKKGMNAFRKAIRLAAYVFFCWAMANTFISYFVGMEQLKTWWIQSPARHPIPFLVQLGMTAAFVFHFSYFREQLCLIACPYGRFQSVMLDRQSLIVSYDRQRGEPRGKVKKNQTPSTSAVGDCVDCRACVRVCPTGIDIRNGLQMECVNCTQCIDACDDIMTKLNRPTGLIRYSSQNADQGMPSRFLRPRLFLYPTVLLILGIIFFAVLMSKKSFDAVVLRQLGAPFVLTAEGDVQNLLRLKVHNRGETETTLDIKVANAPDARIGFVSAIPTIKPDHIETIPFSIVMPRSAFSHGGFDAQIRITSSTGDERTLLCRLLGPSNPTN